MASFLPFKFSPKLFPAFTLFVISKDYLLGTKHFLRSLPALIGSHRNNKKRVPGEIFIRGLQSGCIYFLWPTQRNLNLVWNFALGGSKKTTTKSIFFYIKYERFICNSCRKLVTNFTLPLRNLAPISIWFKILKSPYTLFSKFYIQTIAA